MIIKKFTVYKQSLRPNGLSLQFTVFLAAITVALFVIPATASAAPTASFSVAPRYGAPNRASTFTANASSGVYMIEIYKTPTAYASWEKMTTCYSTTCSYTWTPNSGQTGDWYFVVNAYISPANVGSGNTTNRCGGNPFGLTAGWSDCSSGSADSPIISIGWPPSAPASTYNSCPAPGTTASLSWSAVSGATRYDVYAFDTAYGVNWSSACGTNGRVVCQQVFGTSMTFSTAAGRNYQWFIAACNNYGCTIPASYAGSFTCTLPYCNTNLSWGSCNTYYGGNLCSSNGLMSSTYTAYSGGGPCTPTSGPSQWCSINNCYSGYSCISGICISPPSAPYSLSSSCPAPGTTASFSWSGNNSATSYYELFIDNQANPWGYYSYGNDSAQRIYPPTNSFSSATYTGNTYGWWMRACNSAGCSGSSYGSATYCTLPNCNTNADCDLCGASWGTCSANNGTTTCYYRAYSGGGACNVVSFNQSCTINKCYPGSTCISGSCISPPATPTISSNSCPAPGTTASVSWSAVSGATRYDVYAFDLDYGTPNWSACGANGLVVCQQVFGATSYSFPTAAGKRYQWFVDACNSAGCSSTATSTFSCTPPNCNTNADCDLCGASWGTCSANNGTTTCYYRAYSGGGACNVVSFNQSCTINKCYPGSTCISGSCISPPPAPSLSSPSCPAPGTTASFSWSGNNSTTSYYELFIDNKANAWGNYGTGNDSANRINSPTNSFSSTTFADNTYGWWMKACNSAGCSSESYGSNFTCTPMPPPTAQVTSPTNDSSLTVGVNILVKAAAQIPSPGSLTKGELWVTNATDPNNPTLPVGCPGTTSGYWCLIIDDRSISGTSGTFQGNWTPNAVGTYRIAVNAFDDINKTKCTGNPYTIAAGWSSCGPNRWTQINVVPAPPPPTATINSPANGASVTIGQSVSFSATANGTNLNKVDLYRARAESDLTQPANWTAIKTKTDCNGSSTCTLDTSWATTASDGGIWIISVNAFDNYDQRCSGMEITKLPSYWTAHCGRNGTASNIRLKVVPPAPTNPLGSCPVPGTQANLSWTGNNLATRYDVFVQDLAYGQLNWNTAACGQNGLIACTRIPSSSTSYSLTTTPEHNYQWYVNACTGDNDACSTSASYSTTFNCIPPPPPRASVTGPEIGTKGLASTFTGSLTEGARSGQLWITKGDGRSVFPCPAPASLYFASTGRFWCGIGNGAGSTITGTYTFVEPGIYTTVVNAFSSTNQTGTNPSDECSGTPTELGTNTNAWSDCGIKDNITTVISSGPAAILTLNGSSRKTVGTPATFTATLYGSAQSAQIWITKGDGRSNFYCNGAENNAYRTSAIPPYYWCNIGSGAGSTITGTYTFPEADRYTAVVNAFSSTSPTGDKPANQCTGTPPYLGFDAGKWSDCGANDYIVITSSPPAITNCGSGTVPRAEGLVSTPSLTGNFPTSPTGRCVRDSATAFKPFKIPSYDDLKSLYFDQSKSTAKVEHTGTTGADQLSYYLNNPPAKNLIHITGDLGLNKNIGGSNTSVVFVDGNLSFTSLMTQFTYGSGSSGVVFVVKGNVIIDRSVTRIDAVIISGGTIYTAVTGSETSCSRNNTDAGQLNINGSLISLDNGNIIFCRVPSDNSLPAEVINADPKYLVILRNLYSDTVQRWSEIP